MLTLRPDKLAATSIPVSAGWLLGDCMEAKGKQDLWIRQKPEVLEVLREQAVIQSAESSNRIEGVTIPADRLRPVVLGKSRPRDRSEEEIAGYRKALDWIFSRKRPVSIEPAVIPHLHAMAQGGASGDAGRWKTRDNEIVEILPGGERRGRFEATPAKETPAAVKTLCDNYREAVEAGRIPPLLAVATGSITRIVAICYSYPRLSRKLAGRNPAVKASSRPGTSSVSCRAGPTCRC